MILPLLKPAIIAALIYSFVRAVTTVSAVIFLVSAEYEMATTYIINRVVNGDYGVAIAYCSVLIVLMLTIFGLISYLTMPKQLFPEINYPTVFVQTVYPGNSPEDIENLITRPLENELQTVTGIKSLKSNSLQDFSMIFVEFQTSVDIKEALVEVNLPGAKEASRVELETEGTDVFTGERGKVFEVPAGDGRIILLR